MNYTYEDFWNKRGTATFWLTTHFGYRPGALIAHIAAKVGITPNTISLFSLIVACVALFPLVFRVEWGREIIGAWLGVFLLISYWLDCADGLLARVTGRGSSFGAIFDKTIDISVFILSGSVMGVAALGTQSKWISESWQLYILPLSLVPRATLNVLNWLKEVYLYRAERLREFVPNKGFYGNLKRIIGNIYDEITLRIGVGVAWIIGCFWEFTLAINAILLMILIVYLIKSKRELDRYDRLKANSQPSN